MGVDLKIAFLFSGQGAQYPGMMKDLYKRLEAAREVFDKANASLCRDIGNLCFNGTQEELNLTHNTQPCVLAADIAAGKVLQSYGVQPDAVAGFSLGEYAALHFAGVIDLEEVFPLIQVRADAMQEAVPVGQGAMAALTGVSAKKVQELCLKVKDYYVVPANYNSPVQTVVSGTAAGVDELLTYAKAEKIRAMKLSVSAPFHCELMKPAAEKLKVALQKIKLKEAILPVYMNYTGEKNNDADVGTLLVNQAHHAVQWVNTLLNMQRDGIDTFIECGPGKTLSGLVKKTLKDVTVLRVENEKTLDDTLNKLGISR